MIGEDIEYAVKINTSVHVKAEKPPGDIIVSCYTEHKTGQHYAYFDRKHRDKANFLKRCDYEIDQFEDRYYGNWKVITTYYNSRTNHTGKLINHIFLYSDIKVKYLHTRKSNITR